MLALWTAMPALDAIGIDSVWLLAGIDVGALVALSTPVVYFWVIRPYVTARNRAMADLRASEATLTERIIELEDTRARLEQQGIQLVDLAEDLALARARADAANRAKSEFLATMSHELRTPLNAVIGFSEIMVSETFGPVGSVKYRGYARDIHASGQHLLDLINDILDLSKVESGSDELYEENVDPAEIARSVLTLVSQRAEKGGVNLELDAPAGLPLLRADTRKLKQILVNLLTNAIKFSDAGGTVTLRMRCAADTGHLFQVADTGVGISPEDIPKAFLRFGQVNRAAGRDQEGTGLGLPLTKALAEQHGGSLNLHSEPGVGTTVTVSFPAARLVPWAAVAT